jgi:hypothetical protein
MQRQWVPQYDHIACYQGAEILIGDIIFVGFTAHARSFSIIDFLTIPFRHDCFQENGGFA